mmetsp:Transcript_104164/g.261176  ORF Transcript_104164/g.261176 Transcript_104164/m.261176 type:complete len:245 (-) Transcript_104164:7-741(-)
MCHRSQVHLRNTDEPIQRELRRSMLAEVIEPNLGLQPHVSVGHGPLLDLRRQAAEEPFCLRPSNKFLLQLLRHVWEVVVLEPGLVEAREGGLLRRPHAGEAEDLRSERLTRHPAAAHRHGDLRGLDERRGVRLGAALRGPTGSRSRASVGRGWGRRRGGGRLRLALRLALGLAVEVQQLGLLLPQHGLLLLPLIASFAGFGPDLIHDVCHRSAEATTDGRGRQRQWRGPRAPYRLGRHTGASLA